jgi:hypothetical protein
MEYINVKKVVKIGKVAAIIFLFAGIIATSAFAAVNQTFNPSSGNVAQGSNLVVDVVLQGANTVWGVDCYVKYDPNVFGTPTITDHFTSGTWDVANLVSPTFEANKIQYSKATSLGPGFGSLSSPTSLYQITFPVKASAPFGATTISVDTTANVYFVYDNNFTSVTGTTSTATFNVQSAGPTPTVTGLSQSSGSNTSPTPITITGTNFTGATAVYLGATSLGGFTVNSATSISVTVPSGLMAGTYDITVTTANGTSSTSTADHFTVTALGMPTVTGLSQNSGINTSPTPITITGTNFTGANWVHLGATNLTGFSVADDTTITVTVPSGLTAGTYDITVNNANGTSATGLADQFTVNTPGGPGGPGGSIYEKAGGIMMAYPNPFNPNDTANPLHMLFNAATGEAVNIYIFDTNARIIYQDRDNQLSADRIVTWDGETSYGETVENGLYLIRVVKDGKLVAKGKILVIKK